MILFLKMLEDKKSVLKALINDHSQCQTMYTGLDNIAKNIDGADIKNLKHYTKTLTKVLKKQSDILTRLTLLAIVYSQGSNFDSDIGTALCKMGKGEEALKAMFKNKMGS